MPPGFASPTSIGVPDQFPSLHAFGYGNFVATVDPTVNDDATLGYTIGSWWYKAVAPYGLWTCVDNTEDAAVWVEMPLADRGMRVLFDHWTDAATTGTAEETLYIDQIDAGTLGMNGDKITAEYWGTERQSGNHIKVSFGGTQVFYSKDIAENPDADDIGWEVRVEMIRVSNDTLRFTTIYSVTDVAANTKGFPWIVPYDLASLDFATVDYDLELKAESTSSAGDITAKMAHAEFKPAASSNTDWLLDDDGIILRDDDYAILRDG